MYDFSVIRSLRKKRGISAEDLAARSGLTRATVVKVEAGQGNPTVATLGALAGVLGLSGSELLRLAEVEGLRRPETSRVRRAGYKGRRYRLGELEFFHLESPAGAALEFDPAWHGDTGETILVLSGRLRLLVGGQAQSLVPGEALGFKALHEHRLEVVEDSEYLILHHALI
jgi:XRE family transcriptional regulator, regulator of sulfur utilization